MSAFAVFGMNFAVAKAEAGKRATKKGPPFGEPF